MNARIRAWTEMGNEGRRVRHIYREVIEVFEDSAAGTVLITGDQENEVDTFTGTVAEFQASGEWRLLEG